MRKPGSVKALENLGRVRLSKSFFMRDMLYSEIANFHGFSNIPDDPDLAIEVGKRLCEELLEPLQARFGRVSIRSAYRSADVNAFGNKEGLGCARNEANYSAHIWDHKDANGRKGAMACVVINSFIPFYEETGRWQGLAWWVHDHLSYSSLEFFSTYAAFNIGWHECPARKITSYIGGGHHLLTEPGMSNHEGSHSEEYGEFLASLDDRLTRDSW